MKQSGFTLIELLVVISIIGMLSSVILPALNGARAKSYNSAIVSTIESYINAFLLSYHEDGGYPGTNTVGATFACVGATSCIISYVNYTNIDTKLTRFFPGGPPPVTPDINFSNSRGFVYQTCTSVLCNTATIHYYLKGSGISCPKGSKVILSGWIQCSYTMD